MEWFGYHTTTRIRPSHETTHNDKERELWIINDEGLYLQQRRSGLSMRNFIRQNRKEIDECIALRMKHRYD